MTSLMRESFWVRLRRGFAAAAAVAVIVTAGTGCTWGDSDPAFGKHWGTTMNAREGRDKLVEFVINTTKQTDIQGWWPAKGPAAAQDCRFEDGGTGALYVYAQWAPRGIDFKGDAKRVADYWKSLGMRVRITDTTPHPVVYGEGGPVLRASFDTAASDNSYRVGGGARCSRGDWFALNKEDSAARKQGAVLPGDEGVIFEPDPRDRWTRLVPEEDPD